MPKCKIVKFQDNEITLSVGDGRYIAITGSGETAKVGDCIDISEKGCKAYRIPRSEIMQELNFRLEKLADHKFFLQIKAEKISKCTLFSDAERKKLMKINAMEDAVVSEKFLEIWNELEAAK